MATKPTGRPRGRPKGAKNLPKTVEAFVTQSLETPITIPKPPPKKRTRGVWAGMTPEERSEYARSIAAKRSPSQQKGGRKRGVSGYLSAPQQAQLIAEQTPIVKRMIQKMADNGLLPDDPRAVEALEVGMLILRTEPTVQHRIAAARLVLDFTKSKPSTKIETTIRTAEDFLDELADEDTK